jgi:hypothetical protein
LPNKIVISTGAQRSGEICSFFGFSLSQSACSQCFQLTAESLILLNQLADETAKPCIFRLDQRECREVRSGPGVRFVNFLLHCDDITLTTGRLFPFRQDPLSTALGHGFHREIEQGDDT